MTITRNRFKQKTTSEQGKGIREIAQKQQLKAGNPNLGKDFPANFKPGQSGNPGGKPQGARNRLQGDFMRDLSEDFAAHGKAAIAACRTEKPDVYLKIVASLMPKELDIKRPLDDLTDDELDSAIAFLRERLSAVRALH